MPKKNVSPEVRQMAELQHAEIVGPIHACEHLKTEMEKARGLAQEVDAILEYHDESFHLHMLFPPLSEGLDAVSRGISVVSPDTLIKPGSTLSNLGNVRLTC